MAGFAVTLGFSLPGVCAAVFFGAAGALAGVVFLVVEAAAFATAFWSAAVVVVSAGLVAGFLRAAGLTDRLPDSAGAGVVAGASEELVGLSLGVVIAKTPVTCYWYA